MSIQEMVPSVRTNTNKAEKILSLCWQSFWAVNLPIGASLAPIYNGSVKVDKGGYLLRIISAFGIPKLDSAVLVVGVQIAAPVSVGYGAILINLLRDIAIAPRHHSGVAALNARLIAERKDGPIEVATEPSDFHQVFTTQVDSLTMDVKATLLSNLVFQTRTFEPITHLID